MSVAAYNPGGKLSVPKHGKLYWSLADTLVVAKRQLIHTLREPEQLAGLTIMPVLFIVLFRYVFGGAIHVTGMNYANYLLPGIFAQNAIFSALDSAPGFANDLQKGVIDRFRSLPMTPWAFIAGRTVADLLRNVFLTLVMIGIGLVVGFRPEGNPARWVLAGIVMLGISFTVSWLGAALGLWLRNPEAANTFAMAFAFPLSFASSVMVPTSTMPSWMQGFVDHQPITLAANAVRALFLNQPVGNDLWQALVWFVGILAVFMFITVRLYRRLGTH